MRPVLLEIGGLEVPSYAVTVVLAFLVGGWLRKRELHRLGWADDPRHLWIGLGGLLGAVVGAKLGMFLFQPPEDVLTTLWRTLSLDFTGKTVLGGLTGGYLGVELTKRVVGVRESTGDAWVIALPVAQAIGRVGCFLQGCCYGTVWDGPVAVYLHGAWRHPAPLYELGLDLMLAGTLAALRFRGFPPGHLFKGYVIGYALLRFGVEAFRGDPAVWVGPLKAAQWYCLVVAFGFGLVLVLHRIRSAPDPSRIPPT